MKGMKRLKYLHCSIQFFPCYVSESTHVSNHVHDVRSFYCTYIIRVPLQVHVMAVAGASSCECRVTDSLLTIAVTWTDGSFHHQSIPSPLETRLCEKQLNAGKSKTVFYDTPCLWVLQWEVKRWVTWRIKCINNTFGQNDSVGAHKWGITALSHRRTGVPLLYSRIRAVYLACQMSRCCV